jgi:hypothetical protein
MKALSRWRIVLDTRLLNAAATGNLVGGIEKVAASSALMAVPTIAASYAALVKKNTALTGLVAAVVADDKQLKADITARDLALSAVILELLGLKSLVVSNATSAADITAMGFALLNSTQAARTQPDPPAALLVTLGKAHGKARVTVAGAAPSGHYVAQIAADPVAPTTTWSDLPGNGKQRKLSGYATGTKLWVRFAQVRWGLQSDWSTPVLLTIP